MHLRLLFRCMDNVVDPGAQRILRPFMRYIRTGNVPQEFDHNSKFRALAQALRDSGRWEGYKDEYSSLYNAWIKQDVTANMNDYKELEKAAMHDIEDLQLKQRFAVRRFVNTALYKGLGSDANPVLAAAWAATDFNMGNRNELENSVDARLLTWLKDNAYDLAELAEEFGRQVNTLISRYENTPSAQSNGGLRRAIELANDYRHAKNVFYDLTQGMIRSARSFTPDRARDMAAEFWSSAASESDPGNDTRIMAVIEPLLPQSTSALSDLISFLEDAYNQVVNILYFGNDTSDVLQKPESLLVAYLLDRNKDELVQRWQQFLPIDDLETIANAFGDTVMNA